MSSGTEHPKSLKMNRIIMIQIPLMLIVPMITYTVAVRSGEVQPFPNPSVTETACFYPQNILFRFVMLTASTFFALVFFAVFKWLNYEADRIKIPLERPASLYWASQLALIPFTITIGTIDGAGTGPLHAPCAVLFFTVFWLLTIIITYIVYRLKEWDSSVLSLVSWRWKLFTCSYVTLVWFVCTGMFIFTNFIPHKLGDPGDWIMVIEWNTVFINIIWLMSFKEEFSRTYLRVVGKK